MKNKLQAFLGKLKTNDARWKVLANNLLAKDPDPERRPRSRPLLDYHNSVLDEDHKEDIRTVMAMIMKLTFKTSPISKQSVIEEIEAVLTRWPVVDQPVKEEWTKPLMIRDMKDHVKVTGVVSRFANEHSEWFRKEDKKNSKRWTANLSHPKAKPFLNNE